MTQNQQVNRIYPERINPESFAKNLWQKCGQANLRKTEARKIIVSIKQTQDKIEAAIDLINKLIIDSSLTEYNKSQLLSSMSEFCSFLNDQDEHRVSSFKKQIEVSQDMSEGDLKKMQKLAAKKIEDLQVLQKIQIVLENRTSTTNQSSTLANQNQNQVDYSLALRRVVLYYKLDFQRMNNFKVIEEYVSEYKDRLRDKEWFVVVNQGRYNLGRMISGQGLKVYEEKDSQIQGPKLVIQQLYKDAQIILHPLDQKIFDEFLTHVFKIAIPTKLDDIKKYIQSAHNTDTDLFGLYNILQK